MVSVSCVEPNHDMNTLLQPYLLEISSKKNVQVLPISCFWSPFQWSILTICWLWTYCTEHHQSTNSHEYIWASSEFSHVPRMTAWGTFLQPWSFQLWKGNTRLPSLLLLTLIQNPLIRTSPLNVLNTHALIITPQKLWDFPSIPPCPLFDFSPPSLPTYALAMTPY